MVVGVVVCAINFQNNAVVVEGQHGEAAHAMKSPAVAAARRSELECGRGAAGIYHRMLLYW